MSLISKQIEELRAYAADRKGELAKMVSDAADTIESLSEKLSAANMERSSQYYNDGWIPVTERLPEEQGRYLVDAVGFEPNSVSVATYGIPYAIEPEDEKLCFYYSEEFDYPIEVSAWMPLPEPYKERTDETD